MTGLEKIARGYAITVRNPADAKDGYHVLYVPRMHPYERGNGGAPRRVGPAHEAVVHTQGEAPDVRWLNAPRDPEASIEDFDQDARVRVQILHAWLGRLMSLINDVETWVRALDWSTRRVEKSMEDSQVGKYQAPALLMQEGVIRILLEPVGRSAPGTEGVVDLYLMPAYDDIATLFYYDGRWNLHTASCRAAAVDTVREAPAKPLSKETLQEALDEMKQNAA